MASRCSGDDDSCTELNAHSAIFQLYGGRLTLLLIGVRMRYREGGLVDTSGN